MESFGQEILSMPRRPRNGDLYRLTKGHLISETLLLGLRLLSLALSSTLFMYIVIGQGVYWALYLSNWGVFLVAAQFTTLCLAFNSSTAQVVAAATYELTWSSQWLITLLFWTAIYPIPGYSIWEAVGVHGGMLLLIVLDYCLCRHSLALANWKMVLLPLLVYLIFVLAVSVTINPVYPILTFIDLTSYIFIAMAVVVAFGALFLGQKLGQHKAQNDAAGEIQMNPIL
jgi:hypothetical protein